jgi:hypothetical protein
MGHLQQGLAPSHGKVDWTHWSQACLEVVALLAEEVPLRREGVEETRGFSLGWHLLICLERRSLRRRTEGRNGVSGAAGEGV